MAEKDKKEGV
jgi:small subunit ribosomal protein S20e